VCENHCRRDCQLFQYQQLPKRIIESTICQLHVWDWICLCSSRKLLQSGLQLTNHFSLDNCPNQVGRRPLSCSAFDFNQRLMGWAFSGNGPVFSTSADVAPGIQFSEKSIMLVKVIYLRWPQLRLQGILETALKSSHLRQYCFSSKWLLQHQGRYRDHESCDRLNKSRLSVLKY